MWWCHFKNTGRDRNEWKRSTCASCVPEKERKKESGQRGGGGGAHIPPQVVEYQGSLTWHKWFFCLLRSGREALRWMNEEVEIKERNREGLMGASGIHTGIAEKRAPACLRLNLAIAGEEGRKLTLVTGPLRENCFCKPAAALPRYLSHFNNPSGLPAWWVRKRLFRLS